MKFLSKFPTPFRAVISPFSNSDKLVPLAIYVFSILSISLAFILRRLYIIGFSIKLIPLPDIGLGVRVFANGRVIPKTQKMVLDASLLNTQHYKVRIKGKVEQSREGVAPSPTHWCSSYRKGSLRVTLDYGHQLFIFSFYW